MSKYLRCKELGNIAWEENSRLNYVINEAFDDRIKSEKELKDFQKQFVIKDS